MTRTKDFNKQGTGSVSLEESKEGAEPPNQTTLHHSCLFTYAPITSLLVVECMRRRSIRMVHKFHNRSLALTSNRESDVKAKSAPGGTSLLMRQIAIAAFLFTLGTAVGVFLASLPVRQRTPLGSSFPAN